MVSVWANHYASKGWGDALRCCCGVVCVLLVVVVPVLWQAKDGTHVDMLNPELCTELCDRVVLSPTSNSKLPTHTGRSCDRLLGHMTDPLSQVMNGLGPAYA